MDRKLAAILAADVVGYSALMERDEAGTHERLTAGRKELFEPEIARHHGRVFKLMGDGLLAEFASVVDAVECAVSLQRGLTKRNAAVPADQGFSVRIGINLGEVIIEGDDRFGEGVNIASRLQELAPPGGICVSGKVAKEVEKKLAFGFEPMGAQKVKNIAEPVQAFRVKLDGVSKAHSSPKRKSLPYIAAAIVLALILAGGAVFWFQRPTSQPTAATETTQPGTDSKPSLVVLPFASLSDDKEQSYLADGITEDLTTELARLPGLFVVSRTAAFNFKGKNVNLSQIAKDLKIRYVLEGSIRRNGADTRINAQLIDATTGGHVWAERFDGAWSDVFRLQDQVVGSVAGALKLRLVGGERLGKVAGGTENAAAYDAYLKGLELEYRNTPENIAKATALYEQAITLDPNFGTAIAQLASVYNNANWLRISGLRGSQEEINAKLFKHLRAAALHPSPTYYQIQAELLVNRRRKYDEAIALLEKAIALDPSDPLSYEAMSQALILSGRAADGQDFLDAAMRVDPGWTNRRRYLEGFAYFGQSRFADAAASLQKIDLESVDVWTGFLGLQLLAAADGQLGRAGDFASVREALKPFLIKIDSWKPEALELTGLLSQALFPFKNEIDAERLRASLVKAGIPELPFGLDPRSPDRLTGPEIKTLYWGHEMDGRHIPSHERSQSRTDMDGTLIAWSESGWNSGPGMSWVEGNSLCFAFWAEGRVCAVIFRNPKGKHEWKDEYFFYHPRNQFEFSVVK